MKAESRREEEGAIFDSSNKKNQSKAGAKNDVKNGELRGKIHNLLFPLDVGDISTI